METLKTFHSFCQLILLFVLNFCLALFSVLGEVQKADLAHVL